MDKPGLGDGLGVDTFFVPVWRFQPPGNSVLNSTSNYIPVVGIFSLFPHLAAPPGQFCL